MHPVVAWLGRLVLLLATLGFASPASAVSERKPDYTYVETRNLVSLVEDAAGEMERQGTAAFQEFGVAGSRWRNGDHYLFVFAADGTCVFQPADPDLVGRNLIALKDMNGKPFIRQMTDIASKPGPDASDWVFYLWHEDTTQLIPQWISTYVRKVVAPDHKIYLLGSGTFNIRIEKAFVTERLRQARELLETKGKDVAFAEFRDPASIFAFLDTYIFVLDERGHALVDPVHPTMEGRDVLQFRDAVGFFAVRELMSRLQHADTASVQYLWLKPMSPLLVRKLMVARKVNVGGETLILGSDFFLATPIWMKVEDSPSWRNPPV